ncbi:TRAP transporter small permease [Escherichia albertii]|uniref:TRAP transporter small permease protein n=1 Tax=Escherichia albertii TaxID=208962 RepID=A0ABX5HKY3_ESCAL|nr:TRAP transporter small permease [Escherichia albertii]EFX6075880.1 TRAP transporter small permease [Shigella boydii]CTU68659.1 2%2C3-diketo-L-gulonate TRAP transporter%2C small permease protein [Escherichia coli]EFA6623121.1 TRAP transporter small permease [Escherichia albertii]EFA7084848.1 TRAP transporter small permease [Escherichia albertii]EFF0797902.1 TRAP transporter small permease [Escherichia albertii]
MKIYEKATRFFIGSLEAIMVICISIMFLLVLINVLMRFIFNSGIDIAEELPRFLFVWMIFIGAVVAIKDQSHIRVDLFINKMPVLGQQICQLVSQVLMLVCSITLIYGTWIESDILSTTYSPVLDVNMLLIFGISWLTGVCIFISVLINIISVFTKISLLQAKTLSSTSSREDK